MNSEIDESKEVVEVDLRRLISVVWRKRWWVFASVILFTGSLATAAFVIRPVYSASTVVIPTSSCRNNSGALGSAFGQFGGLASLAGVNIGSSDSETTEALAILRSREFIEKFISDKDLMPRLFMDKWDASNSEWKVSKEKQPTPSKAYRYFTKNVVNISQDRKTSLVTVNIDWTDRVTAAEWANELVGRINETMRLRAIANADLSVSYLEKELKSTSVVATQEAINRLIEVQVKQRMLANVAPEYCFRVVDKALAVDPDEFVKPKRLAMTLGGMIFGFGFGVFGVLLWLIARHEIPK